MSDEFQTWKEHFINQSKGLIPHQRKFYKVSLQKGRGDQPIIKMVAPTEQVVDRAKSKLTEAPNIYDPVTGAMQQTDSKHIKVKEFSRKRKHTTKKKNNGIKKRKITKNKSTKRRKVISRKGNKSKIKNIKKNKKQSSKKRKGWWL
jgi:hypothetical protein